jgi:hypothetical protein
MSQFVFLNAYVELATVDYSANVKSVVFNFTPELQEDTAMGDLTHAKKPGLKNWTVDIEFYQDFVDDGLDEVLQALVGSEVAIAIRPDNDLPGAPTDANPEYQMTGLFDTYSPVSGSVGEISMVKAHFVPGATGAIVRAVA